MAQRRGAGEASVYRQPDGCWIAAVELGRDLTGERIRKTVKTKTKREVLAKIEEIKARPPRRRLRHHRRRVSQGPPAAPAMGRRDDGQRARWPGGDLRSQTSPPNARRSVGPTLTSLHQVGGSPVQPAAVRRGS